MKEIRITIKCQRHVDHQKILRLDAVMGMQFAERLAELLTGVSPFYIHKPGPDSPIGKCATCGGELKYEIEERLKPDAKPKR